MIIDAEQFIALLKDIIQYALEIVFSEDAAAALACHVDGIELSFDQAPIAHEPLAAIGDVAEAGHGGCEQVFAVQVPHFFKGGLEVGIRLVMLVQVGELGPRVE